MSSSTVFAAGAALSGGGKTPRPSANVAQIGRRTLWALAALPTFYTHFKGVDRELLLGCPLQPRRLPKDPTRKSTCTSFPQGLRARAGSGVLRG